jgi:hypothetical protein
MSERRGKYSTYATEAQLQQLVIDWCGYNGYVVIVTGQYKASQRPVNTIGTPDLYIAKRGTNLWRAVELKTPTGRIRQEQALLVADGVSNVCRSLQDVQRLLGEAE